MYDTWAKKARKGDPPNPELCMMYADGSREERPNYWYKTAGKGFFRFRHGETVSGVWPYTNDGKMNMLYTDGHVTTWRWSQQSAIYPKSGDGLWTSQDDFYWWDRTKAKTLNY